MKVLLAVTMTMFITGSAFAACSKENVKDCKSQAECEGIKYVWNEKADVKCISTDGPVATNCAEGDSANRTAKAPITTPGAAGQDSKNGIQK